MTADNKKEKEEKVEENLEVNDDSEIVFDKRGFYLIGEKWYVKIRRINVAEMIAAWGVVSQAFMNTQDMNLDFEKAGTWLTLFLGALPYAPGKFYQFIERVLELQNTSDLTDEKFYAQETKEYSKYIWRDLKTEELVDVINTIYNQEKDRFADLLKKVRPILEPLIQMWKEDQIKRAEKSAEALEKFKTIGKKGST